MFQNAEDRRKSEEATERREHYLAHWLPLLPEAPADFIPLQGIPPSREQCEQFDREIAEARRERHRKRWEGKTAI